MPPKIAKLAGLGAYVACLGVVAVYGLFLYVTRSTPSSGLDPTLRALARGTVAGVIVAVLGVHVMFGHRLLAMSKGEAQRA